LRTRAATAAGIGGVLLAAGPVAASASSQSGSAGSAGAVHTMTGQVPASPEQDNR
jgi:hypothetical protein